MRHRFAERSKRLVDRGLSTELAAPATGKWVLDARECMVNAPGTIADGVTGRRRMAAQRKTLRARCSKSIQKRNQLHGRQFKTIERHSNDPSVVGARRVSEPPFVAWGNLASSCAWQQASIN